MKKQHSCGHSTIKFYCNTCKTGTNLLFGIWILSVLYMTANSTNQVATALQGTCLLSSGNVTCWGLGHAGYGTLGTGNTEDLYEPPTNPIDLGDDFIPNAINCGENHCCCISTNKTLKCWGQNNYGQLGLGDTNNRGDETGEMGDNLLIIDLGSNFDVEQVSCGGFHTCALSTNHEIKCFGRNDRGELGMGNTQDLGDGISEMGDNLSVIDLGTNFESFQVHCGYWHSCALSTDFELKCWGSNSFGQLGQEDSNFRGDTLNEMGDYLNPIDLGSEVEFNVSNVRCGYYHTCALSSDYNVKCWGANGVGQLGYGDVVQRGDGVNEMSDNLDVLDLGSNFETRIMGISAHVTLTLSANGILKAFGWGGDGQLGTGNTESIGDNVEEMGDYLSLIDLGDGYTITDIAINCCSDHSCVLLENGTDSFIGLKCWGGNSVGQLGLSDTENRGDDENEMGDYLPFVSISITTPTAAPTANPSTDPTALPTMKPTAIPTTTVPSASPSRSPSIEPSSAPSASPTVFPTFSPTAEPSSGSPTVEPTANPSESPTVEKSAMETTTTCNAQQNCTECMQMNSDETTLCLWHSTNGECFTLDELEYIDENVIFEETLCSEVEEQSATESILSGTVFIIIIIAVGSLLVISCCILIFVILRKRKKRTNQGKEAQEVVMVNIDMNQSNVVQRENPNMYPNLSREPDLPDSPKNAKSNVIPNLNSNLRSEGRQAEDEGIEEMFTTTAITTRGAGVQSFHNDNVTMDIDGAR